MIEPSRSAAGKPPQDHPRTEELDYAPSFGDWPQGDKSDECRNKRHDDDHRHGRTEILRGRAGNQ